MAICTICGKGKMAGRKVRHKHSGLWERKAPKTVRTFLPNIQKRALLVADQSGEVVTQIKLCTKCLKKIRKEPGWHGYRVPVYAQKTD